MLRALWWGRNLYRSWIAPPTLGVQGIILHQDRILLVQLNYADSQAWTLPGGGVKRHETLTKAFRREIKEELNADVEIKPLHGLYSNFWRGTSDHIIVFVAVLTNPNNLKPNWEISAFEFFPLDDLPISTSPATQRRIEEYLGGVSNIPYRSW